MENRAQHSLPSAEEALSRWGEMWKVLGFKEVGQSMGLVRGSLMDGPIHAGYCIYPRDYGSANRRQIVRTVARIDQYGSITPEEADVLSALLLGH